jgi:DNA integrity scanning protein DisA with diadenylate cyclase activity
MLAIVFRILRLSTQSTQTLRIIIETATKAIQCAVKSGNYRGEEIHKIIKQINKTTSRDREKSACQRVVASMLVDCLKNRQKINIGAFFKLLDLLLHDNYSMLLIVSD